MKVDLLAEDEEKAYEEFLDRCSFTSVQSHLSWRNAIVDMGQDKPFFLVAKKKKEIIGGLPLYYFKGKYGSLLTTVAWHTVSGVSCSKTHQSKDIYKSLLEYSIDLGRELDCTLVSVNTNPFLDDKEYYQEYFKPDYVMENFVQYVRIDEIFGKDGKTIHPNYTTRTNLSRNLEKARQKPITIYDDQSPAMVNECYDIHEKRMNELGIHPCQRDFFHSILNNVTLKGQGKFLCAVYEGKKIATCLFLSSKTLIDAYMLCMDCQYSGLGTNYLLTYHMLKHGYETKTPVFNWMSSPRRGDGVYRWKEQWGSHERTSLYLTKSLHDISPWKNMNWGDLGEAYRGHYLLPFNLLKDTGKFTTKDELTSYLQSHLSEANE